MYRLPTLVVVSGPAGCGKTTLAHRLAAALACPAVCRDEIKEGMAHTAPDFEPGLDDELSRRTRSAFFDVLGLLLERGVTVVAEAAFQHHVWAPHLLPLTDRSEVRVVQCHADPAVATQRITERAAGRPVHADALLLEALAGGDGYFTDFRRVEIDAPSIDVDATVGYVPPIETVVDFIAASA